jgi:serine/threonine protein kinase
VIKDILGQGGFGITYLAHDNNLDREVAIKEYLPIELAVREGDFSIHPMSENHGKQFKLGLDRFISEARTLARFKHPNIVQVLSVFEENNTGYMVMPYERGQSLGDKISNRKTLEESELLKILIPILGGLEIVHEAGFIHRDIKPDNIFIRDDGSPVLLDFGSARQALGVETKTLTSLVTPGYAPFEQYYSKSDEQGIATDIYGLAATIYRAIAGISPRDAIDRSKSILETSRDTLVPAIEIGQGRYSERLLKAIDHALAFKTGDRPQSIEE